MFKHSARQLSPLPCVLRQCETTNRLSYLIKIFLPLSLLCRQPSSCPDGFQHPFMGSSSFSADCSTTCRTVPRPSYPLTPLDPDTLIIWIWNVPKGSWVIGLLTHWSPHWKVVDTLGGGAWWKGVRLLEACPFREYQALTCLPIPLSGWQEITSFAQLLASDHDVQSCYSPKC